MVLWFNGDVDHDHKITLQDIETGQTVFNSPIFVFNEASTTIVLNHTGSYRYYEADVLEDDPDFVMEGTIDVMDNSSNSGRVNIDTVGTFMVPAQDLNEHILDLKSRGFGIDSIHTFQDLRGGQEGTGPQQTLIVWTADSQMSLDKILSDFLNLKIVCCDEFAERGLRLTLFTTTHFLQSILINNDKGYTTAALHKLAGKTLA